MNIEASKMHLEKVDAAFDTLKKDPTNTTAINTIEKELKAIFDDKFEVKIIKTKPHDPWSVMSVYPSKSTMEKITQSILKEEPIPVVRNLWEKNREWYIEIDSRTISDAIVTITPRQLTALILHEIGHVKDANAIPNRITKIVRYQYAQLSTKVKSVFKTPAYNSLVTMPIVDGMSLKASMRKKGLDDEFSADQFANKYGYGSEVAAVLEAIISRSSTIELDTDRNMDEVMKFISKAVTDLEERKGRLVHESFVELMNENSSPYVGEFYNDIMTNIFRSITNVNESVRAGDIACNSVNTIIGQYYADLESPNYVEFFGLKKKLKPLKNYDLDYIEAEIDNVRSHSDKLLILSYAHSKMDIVDYYISILNNPVYAKKYVVPHTMEYLIEYKKRLDRCLSRATRTEVIRPEYGVTINYPVGYEG